MAFDRKAYYKEYREKNRERVNRVNREYQRERRERQKVLEGKNFINSHLPGAVYQIERATLDALSHLTGTPESSDSSLGRCDVLNCEREAYSRIEDVLICNDHLGMIGSQ